MKLLTTFLLLRLFCTAQTFTVLHQFQGGLDGAHPVGGVSLDAQGNVYGTTLKGGSKLNVGAGVVFKINPSIKKETVLLRLGAKTGSRPMASVISDAQGNIYGTTTSGGASNTGTVFKIDAITKKPVVLHSFAAYEKGSTMPVVMDQNGNLYGSYQQNVFKIDGSGQFTILHTIPKGIVSSPLLLAPDGNLYGTTNWGGDFNGGTLFKMDTLGTWTTLASFGPTTPKYPADEFVLDPDGTFYGTLPANAKTCGAAYKIVAGQVMITNDFTIPDYCQPHGLVEDANGILYGVTQGGGINWGTIFSLQGIQLTTLYSFNYKTDGGAPVAGLTIDSAGNLYGTTPRGGKFGYGTVFVLSK